MTHAPGAAGRRRIVVAITGASGVAYPAPGEANGWLASMELDGRELKIALRRAG